MSHSDSSPCTAGFQQDDGEQPVEHVAGAGQVAQQAQREHLEQHLRQVVQDEDAVEDPQDEVVTVSGQNVGVPHQEHADGHEVRKDDGVPQVVEPAVAEEELGALQERRPVLGPQRALFDHPSVKLVEEVLELVRGQQATTVGMHLLHDGLSVGAIHLDFLKHLHEVLGLHPDSSRGGLPRCRRAEDFVGSAGPQPLPEQ